MTCLFPSCKAHVSHARFACRNHWYLLPPYIRNEIWATYFTQDNAGHYKAVVMAIEWYRNDY
jgi:hypothetical protein